MKIGDGFVGVGRDRNQWDWEKRKRQRSQSIKDIIHVYGIIGQQQQ